jgi:hypothetical protein
MGKVGRVPPPHSFLGEVHLFYWRFPLTLFGKGALSSGKSIMTKKYPRPEKGQILENDSIPLN